MQNGTDVASVGVNGVSSRARALISRVAPSPRRFLC